MRAVIWLLLLFVVAVVAAGTLGRNDGLVSLYWGNWRLDVSLNLFVVAFVLACVTLVSALKGVNALLSLPERAREWRMQRRERAAQTALREAQSEFFGARYARAHRAAQRALTIQQSTPDLAQDHELSVLAHLLAAASLHRLLDRPRRDDEVRRMLRLARAEGGTRTAGDGARLMAAEWALDDRDAARALDLLSELPPGVARRTQALRLKLQAQRQQRQPVEALRTARLLAKHQGFSKGAAQGLLRSLACEALEASHDVDQLQRAWQQLDAADRRDPFVCARAAQRAAALGASELGRGWLRPLWDHLAELAADEREQVALALLDTVAGIGPDWLPRLEAALSSFENEPAVVVAVGAAFAERRLWGKASGPLTQAAQSPRLAPRARRLAWRQLAALARVEGDEARAAACDRAAAAID